ncbi:hypothetical protein [Nocardioides sp. SYSU D00038]|uniref:hypothetical protein n=1 Tax=Nocardioides sp. SYSU D00038 TaxID=2812554 RepID=UPI001966CEAB|nr:hypothetical protein [Nocardioides sp. SYSU D00038]
MSLEQTPPAARSDVRPTPPPTDAAPGRPYVVPGVLLTLGAVGWATGQLLFGLDPETRADRLTYAALGAPFQLGLLGLLWVVDRTRALGQGRVAHVYVRVVAVLVVLAIGSTISDAVGATDMDRVGWALLDASWPLSMLGMFTVGVRIAIAGRWRGPARWWPLGAESWALVVIPVMGAFGDDVGLAVSVVHLCLGYGGLGVVVARKQG